MCGFFYIRQYPGNSSCQSAINKSNKQNGQNIKHFLPEQFIGLHIFLVTKATLERACLGHFVTN